MNNLTTSIETVEGKEVVKFGKYQISNEPSKTYKGCISVKCIDTESKTRKKPVFQYAFKSEESAAAYVTKWMQQINKQLAAKAEAKAKLDAAKANFENPYKVGQVFYASWGYEQTNVNFYQIIEVKAKSVVMREIKGEMIEGSEGMMCGRVKPVIDSFCGSAFTSIVRVKMYNDQATHNISAGRHYISEYTHGDKGTYVSWYA